MDGNLEIYVMNVDGTNPIRLTNNDASDYQPIWSPDGKMILFTSERDGNEEVYMMNVDGSDPVNLTDNPSSDTVGSWSPDGKHIVFNSDRDTDWRIYIMDVDGSNVEVIPTSTYVTSPTWSP